MSCFLNIIEDIEAKTAHYSEFWSHANFDQDMVDQHASVVEEMTTRIGTCGPLDEDQCKSLCTLLNNGPWAADATEAMVAKVNSCMATKSKKNRRGLQTCMSFAQY